MSGFTLDSNFMILDFDIIEGAGGKLPTYDGDYEVTPKILEQELETRNKSMTDNVKVLSIPFSEVINPEGGTTVNIAYIL